MEQVSLTLAHHAWIIDHGAGGAVDPGLRQIELACFNSGVRAIGNDGGVLRRALPSELVIRLGTLKFVRVGVHVTQREISDVIVWVILREPVEILLGGLAVAHITR